MEKLVRIKGESHAELEILADKHQRSMKQFTEQMIAYFKKFKIDPADLKDENVSVALRSLRNDLIGFIKTQEKDKLIPTLEELRFVSQHVQQATTGIHLEESHKQDFKKLVSWLSTIRKEALEFTKEAPTKAFMQSQLRSQQEALLLKEEETKRVLLKQQTELNILNENIQKILKANDVLVMLAQKEAQQVRHQAQEMFISYLKEVEEKKVFGLGSTKAVDEKFVKKFAQL